MMPETGAETPVPYTLTAKGEAFLDATHHSFAVYGIRRDPCLCPSCQQAATPGHGTAA